MPSGPVLPADADRGFYSRYWLWAVLTTGANFALLQILVEAVRSGVSEHGTDAGFGIANRFFEFGFAFGMFSLWFAFWWPMRWFRALGLMVVKLASDMFRMNPKYARSNFAWFARMTFFGSIGCLGAGFAACLLGVALSTLR